MTRPPPSLLGPWGFSLIPLRPVLLFFLFTVHLSLAPPARAFPWSFRAPRPPPTSSPTREGRASSRPLPSNSPASAASPREAPSAIAFRLESSHLWLDTRGTVPLSAVLAEFARNGVEVYADSSLAAPVSLTARGAPLSDALPALLGDLDYLLTWRTLPGPLGRIQRLKSIEVFHPGRPESLRPLRPASRDRLPLARTANGHEYVASELLVGVRPGFTYRQFQNLLADIGATLVDADPSTGAYLLRFPPGTNVEALLPQLRSNPLLVADLNYVYRKPKDDDFTPWHPGVVRPLQPEKPKLPPSVISSASPVAIFDTFADGAASHGSHMQYIASGNGAPVALIDVFGDDGMITSFALCGAIDFACNSGASVLNMSWGSSADSLFLRSALSSAADRGLVLVAAAGNDPTGDPFYPAAIPGVLAVAGTNPDGTPWPSSNHGDFVTLSAPALATTPDGTYAGTSCSAATVSGALAAWRALHPDASPDDAITALLDSLSPPPGDGYGAGTLDPAALSRLLSTSP